MTVVGDPAGMRAAAAQLRFRAESIARLAAQVDGHVGAMTFSGPAAVRWRAAVADQGARLRSAASRMLEAANALTFDAAQVEEARRRELLTGGM